MVARHRWHVDRLEEPSRQQFPVRHRVLEDTPGQAQVPRFGELAKTLRQPHQHPFGGRLERCGDVEMNLLEFFWVAARFQAEQPRQHAVAITGTEDHGRAMSPIPTVRPITHQTIERSPEAHRVAVRRHAHHLVFVPGGPHPEEVGDHAVQDADRVGRGNPTQAAIARPPDSPRVALSSSPWPSTVSTAASSKGDE